MTLSLLEYNKKLIYELFGVFLIPFNNADANNNNNNIYKINKILKCLYYDKKSKMINSANVLTIKLFDTHFELYDYFLVSPLHQCTLDYKYDISIIQINDYFTFDGDDLYCSYNKNNWFNISFDVINNLIIEYKNNFLTILKLIIYPEYNIDTLFLNIKKKKKKECCIQEEKILLQQLNDVENDINNIDKTKYIFSDEECIVCKELYIENEQPLVTLTCGHSFCKTCINTLYTKNCPTCRAPFYNNPQTNILFLKYLEQNPLYIFNMKKKKIMNELLSLKNELNIIDLSLLYYKYPLDKLNIIKNDIINYIDLN